MRYIYCAFHLNWPETKANFQHNENTRYLYSITYDVNKIFSEAIKKQKKSVRGISKINIVFGDFKQRTLMMPIKIVGAFSVTSIPLSYSEFIKLNEIEMRRFLINSAFECSEEVLRNMKIDTDFLNSAKKYLFNTYPQLQSTENLNISIN